MPLAVALTVLSAVIGLAATRGYLLLVMGLLVVMAALALGLYNWRWSLYGLLIYLPFSGILTVLTYPRTQVAVLAKDILFVIPAYVGFVLAARHRDWTFPRVPILLGGALALLVVVQSFNPRLTDPLVPLIGIKVWLFYIPLFFLGYHFLRTKTDLRRPLQVMSLTAILPAVAGITEAALLYSGRASTVYDLYGPAVAASTQGFAATHYAGGGVLLRVPSTFSFVSQYFSFAASMVAVTFAWRRLSSFRRWGVAIWTLMLLASFTSGARGAFLMVPLLVLLILLLTGSVRGAGIAGLLVIAALLATFSLLGADPATVVNHAVNTGTSEVEDAFVDGMKRAFGLTTLGLGTGSSTGASRYAGAPLPAEGTSESWWVKVVLEVGLPGLLVVIVLFAWILGDAFVRHWRLQDRTLRACSAALLGFLIWNLIYFTKGSYIDIDPINVYFWLFAGFLLRIPTLDVSQRKQPDRELLWSTA